MSKFSFGAEQATTNLTITLISPSNGIKYINSMPSSGIWWNYSWKYRQQISNLTTDYIWLYIPMDSHMRSDFNDIRFLDNSSRYTLPYYIESYN